MTLEELRGKRVTAKEKMDAVIAGASSEDRVELTEDEKASYDEAKKEYLSLGDMIERVTEANSFEQELSKPAPTVAGIQSQSSIPNAPVAKKSFENFGEFINAVSEAKSGRGSDSRLDYRSEQSMKDGSKGGFAIPEQFSTEIMKKEPDAGVLFDRTFKLPSGSPPDAKLTLPVLAQEDDLYAGIAFRPIDAESQEDIPNAGDFKLRTVTLQPKAFGGLNYVPNNLLNNWQASSTLLLDLFRKARMNYLEKAIWNGSGKAMPLGIRNSGAKIVVPRQTASKIVYEDIVNMEKEHKGSDSFFYINRKDLPQLRLMKDEGGALIYQSGGNANSGGLPTLLGVPVITTDRISPLGEEADVALLSLGSSFII